MNWTLYFKGWFGVERLPTRKKRRQRRPHHFIRPRLDALEDRTLLSQWSGTISGNTTWTPATAPVVTGDLTIATGATLTVQSGTVVQLDFVRLIVNGDLNAQGAVFTSNQATPKPGDWEDIQVNSGGNAVLNSVQLDYGGGNGQTVLVTGPNAPPSTTSPAASLTLENSTIENSSSNGLTIQHSSPILSNDTFSNNLGAAISMDLDSNPQFSSFSTASFVNNLINGMEVLGGTTTATGSTGGQLDWNAQNVSLWVTGDLDIASGTSLSIAAGQVVKFEFARLIIDGTLTAEGNASQEIYFTSTLDDTVGGDTDNDNGTKPPAPGNWEYIQVDAGGSATLSYADLRYGGGNGQEILLNGSATPTTAAPAPVMNLSRSTLEESSSQGLRIEHSSPTLTDDVFLNNSHDAAMSMDVDSNPQFSGFSTSSFSNNQENGLEVFGGTTTINGNAGGQLDWNAPNVSLWVSGDVDVAAGTSLNIAAGQVVKLAFVRLIIDGTLTADGTAAQPINFTSTLDDTVGGDTDNDNGTKPPAPGNWEYIQVDAGGSATLSYADLRYGGGNGQEILLNGSATPTTAAPAPVTNLSHSTLEESSSQGLRIEHSSPTLTDDVFLNNSHDAAMSMDVDSNPQFSGFSTSSFSNNQENGLEVFGGTTTTNGNAGGQLDWNAPNVSLWVSGDVDVAASTSLNIAAGQVVKLAFVRLIIDGTLTADGTAAQPIYFTSTLDDTVGGDTDNDNGTKPPAPGNWEYIQVDAGGSATLSYADLRYGGGNGQEILLNGSATPTTAAPAPVTNLSHSTLEESSSQGLRIEHSSPTLTDDDFLNNSHDAAMSMDVDSNPQFSGFSTSSFSNNQENGLEVFGGTTTTNGNAGGQLDWNAPNVSLWVSGDVDVAASTSLNIAAGQVVKLAFVRLIIDGTLTADGTAAQPIYFTSEHDSSVGGNTADNSTAPARGDWEYIQVNSGGSAGLVHDVLNYGGGNGQELDANGGTVRLTKSILSNSAADGLYSSQSIGVQAVNDLIFDDAGTGIQIVSGSLSAVNDTIDSDNRGVEADGGSLTVANTLITNSKDSGVYVSGTPAIGLSFNDVFGSANKNYNNLADPTGSSGNLSVNPLYVSGSVPPYELPPTSPVAGKGTTAGAPADDFLDHARGSSVDMGALQSIVNPTTLTWDGVPSGNWTDPQWTGAGATYPNGGINAIVDTSSVVQVNSSQAANALAISSGGQVAVGASGNLAVTTDTNVTAAGTLSVDPNGTFSTGGTLLVDSGGTLSGGTVSANAYQLNDGTVGASLTGPGGLTKDTAGTVTISGANSYAGPTTIDAGTLVVEPGALPIGTSLVIGGTASAPATVILAASDGNGNPLATTVGGAESGQQSTPTSSSTAFASGMAEQTSTKSTTAVAHASAISRSDHGSPLNQSGTSTAALLTSKKSPSFQSAVALNRTTHTSLFSYATSRFATTPLASAAPNAGSVDALIAAETNSLALGRAAIMAATTPGLSRSADPTLHLGGTGRVMIDPTAVDELFSKIGI